MIQVLEFHANSLNKFIRAYLSNYFNALMLQKEYRAICSKNLTPYPLGHEDLVISTGGREAWWGLGVAGGGGLARRVSLDKR